MRGLGAGIRPLLAAVGMDQGGDSICDFRARRIRTQISWENLSANCQEVAEFRIARSGTASAGAGRMGNDLGFIPRD